MNYKISFKVQPFDKMKSNIRQEVSLSLTFSIHFQFGLSYTATVMSILSGRQCRKF